MLKVGDLVEHMFDGMWDYGVVLEINKDNKNLILVCWLDGVKRYHVMRDLNLLAEA